MFYGIVLILDGIHQIFVQLFLVNSNINFSMKHMSAFDLIVILVLSIGGLGLFLRSLKAIDNCYPGA